MKHTQGKLSQNTRGLGADIYFMDEQNRGIITVHSLLCQGDTTKDLAEQQANAILIAEAFNVTNETGKSPAQLAQDNKRLEKQIEWEQAQYCQAILEASALVELNKEFIEVLKFYAELNPPHYKKLIKPLLTKAERINK